LMLCTAAGPDVIPGTNGWWDWTNGTTAENAPQAQSYET